MHHRRSTKRQWRGMGLFGLLAVVALLGLTGCMVGMEPPESASREGTAPQLRTSEKALFGSKVKAFKYAEVGESLPHGIGGSRRYVFVTKPLIARVEVYGRVTGRYLMDVPAPPGGFQFPFAIRVPSSNTLVILDAGGFPGPTTVVIPKVYTYQFQTQHGSFSAQLVRTVSFANQPFGFAEDVAVASNGLMVISDSVLGALWVIQPDGTIAPGITPQSLTPQDAIPALAGCGFPTDVEVGGIPFRLPADFAPGVGSLTIHQGILYFGGTCQGGVSKIALAHLQDQRPPHQRASDIQVVSPRPPGVNAETLKGLTFNRFNPQDQRLYAADPFRLQILRIHPQTGQREVLSQDARLFNFSISQTFLPPLIPGVYTMVVSSDQEHRFSGINVALTEDIFQTPFLLTKVIVLR